LYNRLLFTYVQYSNAWNNTSSRSQNGMLQHIAWALCIAKSDNNDLGHDLNDI